MKIFCDDYYGEKERISHIAMSRKKMECCKNSGCERNWHSVRIYAKLEIRENPLGAYICVCCGYRVKNFVVDKLNENGFPNYYTNVNYLSEGVKFITET